MLQPVPTPLPDLTLANHTPNSLSSNLGESGDLGQVKERNSRENQRISSSWGLGRVDIRSFACLMVEITGHITQSI